MIAHKQQTDSTERKEDCLPHVEPGTLQTQREVRAQNLAGGEGEEE